MRKETENLEKRIITGMVEGTRGRGRPRRAWCDDIKHWTSLSTEELLQSTKDHAAWRSVVCRAGNVHSSAEDTNDVDPTPDRRLTHTNSSDACNMASGVTETVRGSK